MMTTPRHLLLCAAMHTSVCLLNSGFERIVRDRMNEVGPLTSEGLFRCCYVGISTVWEAEVTRSMNIIMVRYCCLSLDEKIGNHVVGAAFCNSIGGRESNLNCKFSISKGKKGRMILSQHESVIEKNSVVLSDEAYLATKIAPCGCHAGPVLVEHFMMAWALMNAIHGKSIENTKSNCSNSSCNNDKKCSCEHEYNNCSDKSRNSKNKSFCNFDKSGNSGFDNKCWTHDISNNDASTLLDTELYRAFLLNVQSGLIEINVFTDKSDGLTVNQDNDDHDIKSSDDTDTSHSTVYNTSHHCAFEVDGIWPLHVQCVIACTAIITCIYVKKEREKKKKEEESKNEKRGCKESKVEGGGGGGGGEGVHKPEVDVRYGLQDKIKFKEESKTDTNGDNDHDQMRHKNSTSFHKIFGNNETYVRSYDFFQIACRLPQNTHGISQVEVRQTKLDGNDKEIFQRRIGFGLYIIGSAVNHSCQPNCAVRYDFRRHKHKNILIDNNDIDNIPIDNNDIDNDHNDCNGNHGDDDDDGNSGKAHDRKSNSVNYDDVHHDTLTDVICFKNKIKNNNEEEEDDDQDKIEDEDEGGGKMNRFKKNLTGNLRVRNKIKKREDEDLEILKHVRLELISTRTIHPGEECLLSYGPIIFKHSKEERRDMLKSQYCFICQCEACCDHVECSPTQNTSVEFSSEILIKSILQKDEKYEKVKINEEDQKNETSETIFFGNLLDELNIIKNLILGLRSDNEKLKDKFHGISMKKPFSHYSEILRKFDKKNVSPLFQLFQVVENDYFSNKKWFIIMDRIIVCNNDNNNDYNNDIYNDDNNHDNDDNHNNNDDKNNNNNNNNNNYNNNCNYNYNSNSNNKSNDNDSVATKISDSENKKMINSKSNNNMSNNNEMKFDMKNKLQKCQKLYQKMFTEFSSIFYELTDLSAHIKSLLLNYKEASKLTIQNINRLIDKKSLRSYQLDDIVVSREKVKLIQALWSAGDYVEWYVVSCN